MIRDFLNITYTQVDYYATSVLVLYIAILLVVSKPPDYTLKSLIMLDKIDKRLENIEKKL